MPRKTKCNQIMKLISSGAPSLRKEVELPENSTNCRMQTYIQDFNLRRTFSAPVNEFKEQEKKEDGEHREWERERKASKPREGREQGSDVCVCSWLYILISCILLMHFSASTGLGIHCIMLNSSMHSNGNSFKLSLLSSSPLASTRAQIDGNFFRDFKPRCLIFIYKDVSYY